MTAKDLLELLKIYEETGVNLSDVNITNSYGDIVIDATIFDKNLCLDMIWTEDHTT